MMSKKTKTETALHNQHILQDHFLACFLGIIFKLPPRPPPLSGTFRHDKQEHKDKDIEGDLVTHLTVPEKLRNLNHVIDGL